MASSRKISLVAGLLYLLTFVSIPTLFLYGQVKGANYIIGAGPDTAAIIGGVLEIIVALAGIGTAVALFPVLKRQNEGVALGRRSACRRVRAARRVSTALRCCADPAQYPAFSGDAGGGSCSLAGLCALVRTARASHGTLS